MRMLLLGEDAEILKLNRSAKIVNLIPATPLNKKQFRQQT